MMRFDNESRLLITRRLRHNIQNVHVASEIERFGLWWAAPSSQSIMKVQWDCSIVIGDDKTKCDASTDCTYKPAPAAGNSTRRLLGNEGEESGATCEASDVASMTVIAVNCPAEYKTMKVWEGEGSRDRGLVHFSDDHNVCVCVWYLVATQFQRGARWRESR